MKRSAWTSRKICSRLRRCPRRETKQVVSAEVKRSSGSLAAGQESKDIQSLVSFQEVQRVSPPRHQKMSKRLSLSASGLAYY